MSDDQEQPILNELSRRIALFDRGEELGDCMGSSDRIYRQLNWWLAVGLAGWCALALAAR